MTMSNVKFYSQSSWADAAGPMNVARKSPQLAIKGESDPQWFKDLQRDGVSLLHEVRGSPSQFAVIKGVVSKEHAEKYAKEGEEWLEGFKLGYKRDDPSTWDVNNLPRHARGGLYSQ